VDIPFGFNLRDVRADQEDRQAGIDARVQFGDDGFVPAGAGLPAPAPNSGGGCLHEPGDGDDPVVDPGWSGNLNSTAPVWFFGVYRFPCWIHPVYSHPSYSVLVYKEPFLPERLVGSYHLGSLADLRWKVSIRAAEIAERSSILRSA
jgi:hypothetical protein